MALPILLLQMVELVVVQDPVPVGLEAMLVELVVVQVDLVAGILQVVLVEMEQLHQYPAQAIPMVLVVVVAPVTPVMALVPAGLVLVMAVDAMVATVVL